MLYINMHLYKYAIYQIIVKTHGWCKNGENPYIPVAGATKSNSGLLAAGSTRLPPI